MSEAALCLLAWLSEKRKYRVRKVLGGHGRPALPLHLRTTLKLRHGHPSLHPFLQNRESCRPSCGQVVRGWPLWGEGRRDANRLTQLGDDC